MENLTYTATPLADNTTQLTLFMEEQLPVPLWVKDHIVNMDEIELRESFPMQMVFRIKTESFDAVKTVLGEHSFVYKVPSA
ncbi:MAG: hypothetical protein MHM6MM_005103 [Cercozoa sp. M6MM]